MKKKKQKRFQVPVQNDLRKNNFLSWIAVFILIALAFLIYSNSFTGDFQYDDEIYVEKNYFIRSFDKLGQLCVKSGWRGRTVSLVSFFLNYKIHRLDVFGYHLVNWLIHLFNGIVVYFLTALLLSLPKLRDGPWAKHKIILPFFAAAIFLSHPIQTQAVSYISQRQASLATLFYLFSILAYLKGKVSGRKINYLFCALSALLGMFTKEIVFTLPFALILTDFCFIDEKEGRKISATKAIGLILLLLIVPLTFGLDLNNVILDYRTFSGSHDDDLITWDKYFYTQARVVLVYLRLLALPIHQTLDYDFPLSQSIFQANTFFSYIFLFFLLFLAVKKHKTNILFSFGVYWFFLTVSVESSIIPIHHVIFEHRVYLPFFGFALVLCALASEYITSRKLLLVVFSLLTLVFSVLTFNRNKIWQDKVLLWTDCLKKSPQRYRPYLNLGN
ncbi:MAG: hypothetical protein HQL27_08880, partial [Candidatus Omnitrophica bacterium]|nr:hypothetical protein [Candidatus Omnitrophota bacterium]